jgi:hypothetical protein
VDVFENLDEPFRRLARTVHAVETWTKQVLAMDTLKPKDRELVEKLQKYADRCRRKLENWSNKSTAERTVKKLDNLWASLLLDVIMHQDKRKK